MKTLEFTRMEFKILNNRLTDYEYLQPLADSIDG